MAKPVRAVAQGSLFTALVSLLLWQSNVALLRADAPEAAGPQSVWAAAPSGGTRVSSHNSPGWQMPGKAYPRTGFLPTSYPAGPFTGTPESASGETWRVFDIAAGVARIGDPRSTDLLARWLETVVRTRHPAAEVTALVDGTRLIVRAPAALHGEIQDLVEQLNWHGPDAYAHLTIAEAVDPGWRRPLVRDLPAGLRGPIGQGLWLLSTARGNAVRAEIAAQRRPVGDLVAGTYRLRHGVPAVFDYVYPVAYNAGLQATGTTGPEPYRPVLGQLEQGLRVVLLPVWRRDRNSMDLYLSVEARWIDRLHAVNTTLQVPGGTQPVTLHVPESGSLQWEVGTEWRPGRTLLVSLGVHPSLQTAPSSGTLAAFTRPTGELLIIGDVRPAISTAQQRSLSGPGWRRR